MLICFQAWGVQNITLVDNGSVSHSNPVRQSLYTFEDCKNSNKKANVAVSALTKIHPKVVGITLQLFNLLDFNAIKFLFLFSAICKIIFMII